MWSFSCQIYLFLFYIWYWSWLMFGWSWHCCHFSSDSWLINLAMWSRSKWYDSNKVYRKFRSLYENGPLEIHDILSCVENVKSFMTSEPDYEGINAFRGFGECSLIPSTVNKWLTLFKPQSIIYSLYKALRNAHQNLWKHFEKLIDNLKQSSESNKTPNISNQLTPICQLHCNPVI